MKGKPALSGAFAALIIIVFVVLAGVVVVLYVPGARQSVQSVTNITSIVGSQTTSTTSGVSSTVPTVSTSGCTLGSSNIIQSAIYHYSSDSTLASAGINIFQLQGSSYSKAAGSGGTSSATDGTAVTGSASFPLNWLTQFTATGTYDYWAKVTQASLNNPQISFGQTVFNLQCTPGANSASNYWFQSGVVFQAPTSGTTQTTQVQAIVTYPGATPTAVPTSSQQWDIKLLVGQAYRAAMLPVTFYGTSGNQVTNFANGTQSYRNSQTVSGYLYIASNQTGIAISAPGIITLSGNNIVAGTKAWAIPVSGCGPVSSAATTSNYLTCIDVPIQIYENVAQGTKHVALVFTFIDNQQIAANIANFVTPAQASFPSTASSTATGCITGRISAAGTSCSGIDTGFTILTSTSGSNAANPAPLVEQTVNVVLTY